MPATQSPRAGLVLGFLFLVALLTLMFAPMRASVAPAQPGFTTVSLHVEIPMVYPEQAHMNAWDHQQLNCLTDNMYEEARGESTQSQIAVGEVLINRVVSSRYPSTICKVVHQRNKHNCAFSWVCHPQPHKIARNSNLYKQIHTRAEVVYKLYYRHDMLVDITKGSLFYMVANCHPSWRDDLVVKIQLDHQIFLASQ